MARGIIDMAGLSRPDMKALKEAKTPDDQPFKVRKIGHLVLVVQDLERSVKFYTEVMGFKVSDVYPETMMPGRMVFMRFNDDHHGVALVGQGDAPSKHKELHHLAFEVATIDEVLLAREHLKKHNVPIDFDGRRRAGCQVAVEFRDPDDHCLEIFWGLDQVAWDGQARPPGEWVEELSLEGAIEHAPKGQDTTLANPALLKH